MTLAVAFRASSGDGAGALRDCRGDWRGRDRSSPHRTGAPAARRAGATRRPGPRARAPARPLRSILQRARSASSGSRSTSVTSVRGARRATARPTTPTPAPTSSTAILAARLDGSSRRQQHGVDTGPIAVLGLQNAQAPRRGRRRPSTAHRAQAASLHARALLVLDEPGPEPGLAEDPARGRQILPADQEPAREGADRAFHHADVLIGHESWRCRPPAASTSAKLISTASLLRRISRIGSKTARRQLDVDQTGRRFSVAGKWA